MEESISSIDTQIYSVKEVFPRAHNWISYQIGQIVKNLESFQSIDYSEVIRILKKLREENQQEVDELTSQFELDASYITISFDFTYEGKTVEFDFGEWSPGEEIDFDEDASEITDLLDELFEEYKENTLSFSYLCEDNDGEEYLEGLYSIVRDYLIKEAIVSSKYGDRELTEEDFENEFSDNEKILRARFDQYLADTTIDDAPLEESMIEFIKDKIKEEHSSDIEKEFEDARDEAINTAEEEFSDLFTDFIRGIKEFILEKFEYGTNIDRQHLSSILDLIDDLVDQSNPVEEYLDYIETELGKGFKELGENLLNANKPKLISEAKNAIFENKALFFYLLRFEHADKATNYLEIQRTRCSIISIATKIIKSMIENFQLDDYVVRREDYESSLSLNLETGEMTRREATSAVISEESFLDSEWKDELAEAENFYKIFPVDSSVKSLGYISFKNIDKQPEPFVLSSIFASMRINAQIAHRTLTKHVYLARKESLQIQLQKSQEELAESYRKLENLIMNREDKIFILENQELSEKKLKKKLRDIDNEQKKLEEKILKLKNKIVLETEELLKIDSYIIQLDQVHPGQETVLKDSANAFLPCFVFLINTGSLSSSRKFFKVDFNIDWLPYFISTDFQDQVYHTPEQQAAHAREEDERFYRVIGDRSKSYKDSKSYRDFSIQDSIKLEDFRKVTGHSERVLTQALRKPEIVKYLVEELKKEMTNQGYDFDEGQTYKVYSVTMIGHSTQIICYNCVRALVAQQASYEEGTFLSLLTKQINSAGSGFWAYQHGDLIGDKERIGIRGSTIIISEHEYNEPQFTAIKRANSAKVEFENSLINIKTYNPEAIIELYKPELDEVDLPSISSKLTLSGSLADKLANSQESKRMKDGGKIEPSIIAKKQALYTESQSKIVASKGGLLCIIAADSPENIQAFESFSYHIELAAKEFHESHRKLLTVEKSSTLNDFDISVTALGVQQGIEFAPTVRYFFKIFGIDLPKISLPNEFWGLLHFGVGVIKIKKQVDLLPGQTLESMSYYAKLVIYDKLSLQTNNDKPTNLLNFINTCYVDMIVGGTLGLASSSPIYGTISGVAACLDKYQILQEESFIQISIRYALDSAAGLLAVMALYQQNPLICVLGIMNAVVMTDITTKVVSSTIDIGLNGLSSIMNNDYYENQI